MTRKYFLFIFSLFSCSVVAASTISSDSELIRLAQSKQWTQLLHYQSSLWNSSKSKIRSHDFFLSPRGATSLVDELTATLHAMAEPVGSNANLHAQCSFPARYKWLKDALPTTAETWPKVICPDYELFSQRGQIESISLLFATGYLSNPASYFGHPLIKFNLPATKMPSPLLDVSVNFGAITPPNENGFVYAAKGLLGGYDATFSHRKFYYNNHAYGELELRDMWEYRLNLSPEEVELFYSHIWELLGKKWPYYFLTENCATAAGDFLEEMTGVNIMPRYLPYSLPYSLFDRLAEVQRANGEPLVRSITLIPSRQTRLVARYKALDSEQKKVVRQVSKGALVVPAIHSVSAQKRAAPIETLLDYFSFLSVKEKNTDEKNEKFAHQRRELLSERLALPSSPVSEMDYDLRAPSEGTRPLLLRTAVVHSSKFRTGGELQMRTTYYDFLALDFGRPKFSEVRTLDATINFLDESVWLRKLDLISVSTLNVSQTGLPGDGGWAWRFSTGLETLNLACKYCDLFKVEAGFGKAFLLWDRQAIFGLVDLRAQTRTAESGTFAGTPTLGALIDWFPSGFIKTEFSFGYRAFIEKNDEDMAIIKIDHRLGLSRDWDLRASYEKQRDEWIRLSMSWYL